MRFASFPFLFAVLMLMVASPSNTAVKADEILAQCSSEVVSVFSCIALDATCAEACADTEVDDSANPSSCKELNSFVCSTFGSCCDSCFAEVEAFGECVGKASGISCDFDCYVGSLCCRWCHHGCCSSCDWVKYARTQSWFNLPSPITSRMLTHNIASSFDNNNKMIHTSLYAIVWGI